MRSKLHLTNDELMNTPWISLCLQMGDFPYFDYKAKGGDEIITEDPNILRKYMKKK